MHAAFVINVMDLDLHEIIQTEFYFGLMSSIRLDLQCIAYMMRKVSVVLYYLNAAMIKHTKCRQYSVVYFM